jgi:CO/xanthine dehydrogenase FAD-binding subunit
VPVYRLHEDPRVGESSVATVNDFPVITPRSLDEALDALASIENLRPLAGGTDLMVLLESGVLRPCTFLNIQDLPELRSPDRITALTTYRDVRTDHWKARFPMLAAAAREVGALAIQSRGTWIGNIANASPAADGVPALMAYDASLEIACKTGRRAVPLANFYRGYKQMDLRPDELIMAVHLPEPSPGFVEYFRKVGARRFQAISKTLLAGRIRLAPDSTIADIRLVFASVAPFTLRAFQTEDVLRGRHLTPETIAEAVGAIQDEIRPIDDIRSTEAYRRRVTANLLRDFLVGVIS